MPYFALIIMYYHVKIACYQRATWRSLIREKKKLVTHQFVLLFCHLLVQVTWQKSSGQF